MADRADELKDLANKAVTKSDFAGAVQHLTEAIGLKPAAKELWSNRAFAYSALSRHEDALQDAQQCIRIAPGFSKGYLRAGRALIALGRHEQAADLLDDAYEKMPQDYALKEALEDAVAAAERAASGGGAPAAPTAAAPSTHAPAAAAGSGGGGGLDSSYYYAAVPASQRKLPVAAPPRIDPVSSASANGASGAGASPTAASGHVREDIARKGSDSYYYAHDRKTDFTVPTVPKRLNADGSMTAWDGK